MYRYLLYVILFFYSSGAYGQFGGFGNSGPKIKGKISGSVIDTLTNQGVGFATISLRKAGRDKIINGTLSEEDGSFSFDDVAPGSYALEFSFIGWFNDSSVIPNKVIDRCFSMQFFCS